MSDDEQPADQDPDAADMDRQRLAELLSGATSSPTAHRSRAMPVDRREAAGILELVLPLLASEGAPPAATGRAVTLLAEYIAAVRHDGRLRMMAWLTRDEIQSELNGLGAEAQHERGSEPNAAGAERWKDVLTETGGPMTAEARAAGVLGHRAEEVFEAFGMFEALPDIDDVEERWMAQARMDDAFRARQEQVRAARELLDSLNPETARLVLRVRGVLAGVEFDLDSQDLWLTLRNSLLDGATPVEAISEGRLEAVEHAARRWGHQ